MKKYPIFMTSNGKINNHIQIKLPYKLVNFKFEELILRQDT